MKPRTLLSAMLAALAALLFAQSAAAFTLGFNDEDLTGYAGERNQPVNEPLLAAGYANGAGAGATTWRFMLNWRDAVSGSPTVAPSSAGRSNA